MRTAESEQARAGFRRVRALKMPVVPEVVAALEAVAARVVKAAAVVKAVVVVNVVHVRL